jgi:hypothetical protein
MRSKREVKAAEAPLVQDNAPVETSSLLDGLRVKHDLQIPVRVEQVTNWRDFLLPEIQDIMSHWRGPEHVDAWAELVQQVEDEEAAVFLAGQDDQILGLLIILLPFNALWPWPYVLHLWTASNASSGVKKTLVESGVAFMKGAGYDRCWALNVAGIQDEVWERVFRAAGTPLKRGTVYEVQF